MNTMHLILGTKAWSSWSLRPWLVMKRSTLSFTETVLQLRWEGASAEIAKVSPSAKVPVLQDGDLRVWDSLAISEYIAETSPIPLWPEDGKARALARSATAEMHSGFAALRNQCPMDIGLRTTVSGDAELAADLKRLVALLGGLRRDHGAGGEFLFGAWTIADAFFTPVATRVRSYDLDLAHYRDDGIAKAYLNILLATPEFLAWESDALANGAETSES